MKFFFLISALIMSSSCSLLSSNKKEIVFIHGSHFDSTSWKPVIEKLPAKEFHSVALDIPKRNNEQSHTLSQLAKMSCDQSPDVANFVVHSHGGAIVNEMMGICPQKIKSVLYVAAVIPRPKEMPFELLTKEDQNNYVKAVIFGEKMIVPKEKDFLSVMAGAPLPADLKVALFPEPVTIGSEALNFDRKTMKGITMGYVHTNNDKIIGMNSQVKYVLRQQIRHVYTIESGHLPMLTNSQELADFIKEFLVSNEKPE